MIEDVLWAARHIAINAPLREEYRNRGPKTARVSWELIEELRRALDAIDMDWRETRKIMHMNKGTKHEPDAEDRE